jgi:uncharacterized protein YbjT (DUF2867 family)
VSPLRVCLLGGTGFVGRRIAARLAQQGHQLRVLTRNSARHRSLKVLPGLVMVDGDVHNGSFLERAFAQQDVVVNLVGILNERGNSGDGFRRVHVHLPEKVIGACRVAGVPRLLHMSALGASVDAPSHYLRTKAQGEDVVFSGAGEVQVTSFRPSVIFGPADSFTNRFAGLLRLAPGVFPLACPDAKFQPVYVEDVARAFVDALGQYRTNGQRYELCGPTTYRLRDIVSYIAALRGRRMHVIGLGPKASYLQALLLQHVPGKPFSLDNYRSLQIDSVCRGENALRRVFGIEPTAMEDVVPGYLRVTS